MMYSRPINFKPSQYRLNHWLASAKLSVEHPQYIQDAYAKLELAINYPQFLSEALVRALLRRDYYSPPVGMSTQTTMVKSKFKGCVVE